MRLFGLLFILIALAVAGTPSQPRAAEPPMSMGAKHTTAGCTSMGMPAAQSAGDKTMNQAMTQMMEASGRVKLTGEQDRDFMLLMIAHHQAAIDMARAQLAHGKHPQLQALARGIISAQQKEILEMRQWLHQWYGE